MEIIGSIRKRKKGRESEMSCRYTTRAGMEVMFRVEVVISIDGQGLGTAGGLIEIDHRVNPATPEAEYGRRDGNMLETRTVKAALGQEHLNINMGCARFF